MNTKFFPVIIFNTLASFVSSIIGFFLIVMLYDKTRDAFTMSLAVFLTTSPRIFLSFHSGRIADRFGKKNIILFSLVALFFIHSTNATVFYLREDVVDAWYILSIQACLGVVSAFYEISLLSSLSAFAGNKGKRFIYSFSNISLQFSYIFAPIISGIFYGTVPILNIIYAEISAVVVLFFVVSKVSFPESLSGSKDIVVFKSWDFIKSNPILLHLLVYFSFFNFINGLTSGLVAAYILDLFSGSGKDLAFFNTCIAIGTFLGGLYSFKNTRIHPLLVIAFGGIIASAAGRVVFGFVDSIYMLSFVAALRMFILPIVNTTNQIVWGEKVPASKQGSVFGFRRVIAQGGYPVAILIGGIGYKSFKELLHFSFPNYFFIFCGVFEVVVSIYLIIVFLRKYQFTNKQQT